MKYTTIIAPSELTPHLDDPRWVIFDCRFTLTDTEAGRNAYQRAHIPGARYAHLDDDLAGEVTPSTGRHPLPDPAVLAEKLGSWGVDDSKQVVVYDDSFGAMASRMWWLLRWLGHDAVALLDGGLPRWVREGGAMTAELPAIEPSVFNARPDSTMWVDSSRVEQAMNNGSVILDARAEERFAGDIEPLDKVAGHVPGAINLPFEDNLDLGGGFLSPEELRELYRDATGSKPPSEIIHMCGSGVTACHNLLAMEVAGLGGAKLYPGSWSEWITVESRPVALGEDN